jgi:hypothetical protein
VGFWDSQHDLGIDPRPVGDVRIESFDVGHHIVDRLRHLVAVGTYPEADVQRVARQLDRHCPHVRSDPAQERLARHQNCEILTIKGVAFVW